MANIEDHTLGAEEGRLVLSSALFARFDMVRTRLEALAMSPPQVIIMEGGTADERFAMAMWWAARLNCDHAPRLDASSIQTSLVASPEAPCLHCPACLQIATQTSRDLHILDGRGANIKIEDVRSVCAMTVEAPVGPSRVIILAEAQSLGDAAANAMLKSLEEPRPHTSFILLTPQRERLLPTLVSRSWVLTLPWPQKEACTPEIAEWITALASFAQSGRGWFGRTGARGAIDAEGAMHVVLACEAALMEALAYHSAAPSHVPQNANTLVKLLCASVSPRGLASVDTMLAHCSESLALQPSPVNPSLVLDWLATRLYIVLRRYAAHS